MWKSAGRAPSLWVLPWRLPYNRRKSTEKTSVRVRKTSVRLRKTTVRVQYTYYQKHPHITKPTQTHITKPTHEHTHAHAPDDGWRYHPKHVEQFPDINKLCKVASCWICIGIWFRDVYTYFNITYWSLGKRIIFLAQWLINGGAVKVGKFWKQVLLNGFFTFYLLSVCACSGNRTWCGARQPTYSLYTHIQLLAVDQ